MTDVDAALAEVRALRAQVRALSGPLPSDPDGRMWSTLNYFASREDDDLDTEVMGWAMSEITGLRTRVAELEAALRPLAMLYVTSPVHAARRLKTYVRVSEDGCGAKVDPADILNAAATLWEYPKVESDIVEDEEARRALGDGHG